jgi:hypothetical protein
MNKIFKYKSSKIKASLNYLIVTFRNDGRMRNEEDTNQTKELHFQIDLNA